MRVYVAAPWDARPAASAYAQELQARGHEITREWWKEEGTPGYELDEAHFRDVAVWDFVAVKTADVLVLLNSQRRGEETSGKAVETGIALAFGVPVIVVGGWTNVFHYFPGVKIVKDTTEATATLETRI